MLLECANKEIEILKWSPVKPVLAYNIYIQGDSGVKNNMLATDSRASNKKRIGQVKTVDELGGEKNMF